MFRNLSVCVMVWCCGSMPVYGGEEKLPSADELIGKHVAAIGGRKTLDAIKSMRMTGKMVMGGGMEAPMTMEFVRPKKLRMEFTFQGMTATQAFDGETGWYIMPFIGKTEAEKMPPEMAKEIQQQADWEGPLIDYQKKGHKVEVEGLDEFSGTPAFKLKMTRSDGEVEYYLLDRERFLLLGTKGSRSLQGMTMNYEIIFGDYKDVQGYVMAHSITQKSGMGMGDSVVIIDKVETNIELPDARFAMPEKKPADKANGG